MASTSSPIQTLQRGLTYNQQPSSVMTLPRGLTFEPVASPILQIEKENPLDFLGIRGKQVQSSTIIHDKLIALTPALLQSTSNIDFTTSGQTIIYSVPTTIEKAIILGVILEVSVASGVSTPPGISIGVSPSTNNIFNVETLTGFVASDDTYTFWNNLNVSQIALSTEDVILNVSTGAVASNFVGIARVFGIPVYST